MFLNHISSFALVNMLVATTTITSFTTWICKNILLPICILVGIVGGVLLGVGLGAQDPHQKTAGLWILIGALVGITFAVGGPALFK